MGEKEYRISVQKMLKWNILKSNLDKNAWSGEMDNDRDFACSTNLCMDLNPKSLSKILKRYLAILHCGISI